MSYTIYLRLSERPSAQAKSIKRGSNLGASRLKALRPTLDNIAANTGGPTFITTGTHLGVPVVKITARFGGDFREALHLFARWLPGMGFSATVFDETATSKQVRRQMGWVA